MGLRLALLATVLLCFIPGLLAAPTAIFQAATASSQPRVLVLGDKIVEDGAGDGGWLSQLNAAYDDTVGLFNLGSKLPNTQGEPGWMGLAEPSNREI